MNGADYVQDSDSLWVGTDWGQSSFRLFLFDTMGRVVLRRESAMGVGAFDAHRAFGDYLGKQIAAAGARPRFVLLSGMITSRHGWTETPYLRAPVPVDSLASSVQRSEFGGLGLYFMPGVDQVSGDEPPDVMRGEETQIAGVVSMTDRADVVVLPGTHSKWAVLEDDTIVSFRTFLTGELYTAMCSWSSLAAVMDGDDSEGAGFGRGLNDAWSTPDSSGQLLELLFRVRRMGLSRRLEPNQLRSYLSGLLVGSEIRAASKQVASEAHVAVAGSDVLAERYRQALEGYGFRTTTVPDTAPRGLARIAARMPELARLRT